METFNLIIGCSRIASDLDFLDVEQFTKLCHDFVSKPGRVFQNLVLKRSSVGNYLEETLAANILVLFWTEKIQTHVE